MTLRFIIDQSHNEFLKFENTRILQNLLIELDFIIFPLVDRPITFETIKDDHVLFIGCPSIPFTEAEIQYIIQFVEKGGFLILISGSGGDFANNTNISEIGRYFEFEFNPDYVEDEKHYLNFSRVPIIYKFPKNFGLTKHVKKLSYSGCSISILDNSTIPLLLTDSDTIPVKTPVMVLSQNHLVFGLGGYSFFTDDPSYGIKVMDNLRFVYNLFELIKSAFIKKSPQPNVPEPKPKKINQKTAKKDFTRLIEKSSQQMETINVKIDDYYTECSDLITQHHNSEAEIKISLKYSEFLETINSIATEIGETFAEYEAMFSGFKNTIQTEFIQWYEIEAETRAKLDMIRNNLSSKLKLNPS